LLDELIAHIEQNFRNVRKLEVSLDDSQYNPNATVTRLHRGQAGRQAQIELIDFYRSRGFSFDGEQWSNGQNTRMVLFPARDMSGRSRHG
jgi:hypothetical protein